jgi:hypothetical protein
MFLNGTGGILHGHIPATKINHTPAHLPVGVIEWSSFELRSRCGQVIHHARQSSEDASFIQYYE